MNVAVVGSGGREHALILALSKSPLCDVILALPGNDGIAQGGLARCLPVGASDCKGIISACKQHKIQYVVIGPDNTLALGLVDALKKEGILAFGPTKAAARIESSKVFAKDLMREYSIPTAEYRAFEVLGEAQEYLRALSVYPVVIKADGLALGKGVLICQNRGEAEAALLDIMQHKVFGESGNRVVIEEFLSGPEVSVLSFCDGERVVPLLSSMDHKRAFDGDEGPNTGGMGAIAPNPFYTPEMAAQCMEEIYLPTMRAMRAEGCPFSGCLYFGLILTAAGPKVIEYNCRFGDPETQAVLPLLEGDILEIMLACAKGRLDENIVKFAEGASACVVLASGGYPGEYATGVPISGMAEAAALPGVHLTFAGVSAQDGGLATAGGRVLGVTATAPTLKEAIAAAYAAAGCIDFAGVHRRGDIGARALGAEGIGEVKGDLSEG